MHAIQNKRPLFATIGFTESRFGVKGKQFRRSCCRKRFFRIVKGKRLHRSRLRKQFVKIVKGKRLVKVVTESNFSEVAKGVFMKQFLRHAFCTSALTLFALLILSQIILHDRLKDTSPKHSCLPGYAGICQQFQPSLTDLTETASVMPIHRTIVTASVDAETIEEAAREQKEERKKEKLRERPSNVPNWQKGCHSDCFSHMGYRAITDTDSPQYALQRKATTDKETGVRMVDGCYLVAVGTYYADHVGQKLDVVMESGEVFTVMVGEFKSDEHTDATHRFHVGDETYPGDGSVLELIVDTSCYTTDNKPDVFDGKVKGIYKNKTK